MKVIIPIFGFGRAGGERVISKLANELIKNGNEVSFIVPEKRSEPYYPTDAKIIVSQNGSGKGKLINFLLTTLNLLKKTREQHADVAIATFHFTAYLVVLLPSAIRKYYYIQAYEAVFSKSKLKKLIAYMTYHLGLRQIVNHEELLPGKINKFIAVVPAGIDETIFNRRKSGEISQLRNIGLIGRKEQHKGTREIISTLISWPKISEFVVNIAIYLSDEDRKRLTEAGVKFNFYPITSDYELSEFYKLNNLMIAVGLVEDGAFHYPCAESMASGCIVISNYAPLCNTDSIYKVMTFDPVAIVRRLDRFSEANEISLIEEIENNLTIVQEITWDKIGKKMNNVLLKDAH